MTAQRFVALVAHDECKETLAELAAQWREALGRERLIGTATTASLLSERTGLDVHPVSSGPVGGDLQIGALVATDDVKLVIFLRDPLNAHPHEPDIQALMKVCDIHSVPLATNRATARCCLMALAQDPDGLGPLTPDTAARNEVNSR